MSGESRRPVRVSKEELKTIAENIESNDGDASELRALLAEDDDKTEPSDEEYIESLKAQSPQYSGVGLKCQICEKECNETISGVCFACFREWALSTRRNQHGNQYSSHDRHLH